MRSFSFNNISLSSFGGRLLQPPSHKIAKRNKNFQKIYGQSGDEIIDNESYDNVKFKLKIGFLPLVAQQTAQNLARAVIDWLAPLQDGYYIYRDTFNPGYYTKAAITDFDEIVKELNTYLTATIEFNRVPFWYKDGGATAITFTNQALLVNSEVYTAEPIITLTAATSLQNVKLTINGVETAFNVGSDFANIFNCVLKQNYRIVDGRKVYLSTNLPPDLSAGENLITLSSSQVTCSIVPNWRRL
jgi:phage-related protein